ncbi:MAG: hypothetical protein AB7O65_09640 [Candidatus Korobacteraceae bacterium]
MKQLRREFHPSEEQMLAAHEGGMAPEESRKIREHVSLCVACRDRLWQLQAGLQSFEIAAFPPIPDSALEAGLRHLSERISAWNKAHPEFVETAPTPCVSQAVDVCEWLVSELSIYLGMRAAKSLVLQACNRPGVSASDVTAVVEPVISGFFGRQTGFAVASQVARLWNRSQHIAAQSGANL